MIKKGCITVSFSIQDVPELPREYLPQELQIVSETHISNESHYPGSIDTGIFDKAARDTDAIYILEVFSGWILSFIDC